jgi:hypothetical protein
MTEVKVDPAGPLGMYTRDQLEAMFGVTEATIRRWEAEESLPSHTVGQSHFYDPEELRAWLRARPGLGERRKRVG